MEKRKVKCSCLSIVAACALLALCCAGARAEVVDNPAYNAWAKCKPGTSVTMKGTTDAAGQNMTIQTISTLSDVTSEQLRVDAVTTVTVGGVDRPGGHQKQTIKKTVDKAEMNQQGKGFDPDLLKNAKTEKVTVPAGTFDAKVVEFTKQQGANTVKIKAWYTEEVPGGNVKVEITGEGQMTMHTTMELVSIDKK